MLSSTAASVLASPSIRSIRRRDVLFTSVTSSRTALSSLVSVYWLLGCSLSDPEEAPANRDTFGEDFDRLALSGPFPFPFRPMPAATGFSGVSESKSFRQPPRKCFFKKFRAVGNEKPTVRCDQVVKMCTVRKPTSASVGDYNCLFRCLILLTLLRPVAQASAS